MAILFVTVIQQINIYIKIPFFQTNQFNMIIDK